MKTRLNDEERRLWILNDEGLYLWHRRSGQSMREFIKANRAELDECINRVLNPKPREKTWRDYA